MSLKNKRNRGARNRFFSSTALGSFMGRYLSNLAIFHGLSNHDVHNVAKSSQETIENTIEKVLCVLGKIQISKANTILPIVPKKY